MAFPVSPTNGQSATVNNIAYTYDSAKNAWTRQVITNINVSGNIVTTSTTTSTSSTTGALRVAGGVGIGGDLYSAGTINSVGGINLNNGFEDGVGIKFQSLNNIEYEIDSSGGNLRIFQPGVVRFVVDRFGRVGVANATPLSNLSVAGTTYTSGNISTAGWIVPTANLTQNLGTTTSWWNVFYGVSTQARYADLAENYQADGDYEPGTVLSFGGNNEVTISTVSHDTAVAGVVSTNPAHLMNGALDGPNVVPLALQGRVPCLVKGPVNKGTVVVSSDTAGAAEALDITRFQPGCVIGKSLENIPDDSIKLIEVVVGRF